jgi:probable F420-dependent oxidoreductase
VSGFDVFRSQGVPWPEFLADVRLLHAAGAHTVWVLDHYAWLERPDWDVYEAWTLLAALAVATDGIRLGTAVTDVALRHPAMLAKQVATVDALSGGRVELGVGAGYYEEELSWLGIPFLTPGGRAARLREAVEIVDGLFRQDRLSYDGEYWRVHDAPLVPAPAQRPRPPLVVAANGPKGIRLAAERADGWLSLGDRDVPDEQALAALRERNDRLGVACAELGRDPATIGRLYYVGWATERPFASPEALRDFLGRYREAGAERLIFVFTRDAAGGRFLTREALEAFAGEILVA